MTTSLLNPSRYGGGGSGVAQVMLSQLDLVSAPPEDDFAFAAWASAYYQPGTDWMVLAARSDVLAIGLRVAAEGQPVHIWWGDGETETVYPPVQGTTGLPLLVQHDYASAARRGVVVIGNVVTFLSNYSLGRSNFITRPGLLPRGLRYYQGGASSRLEGPVFDLPSGLSYLWAVSGGAVGSFADLPDAMTTLYLGTGNQVTGDAADLPSGVEYLYLGSGSVLSGDFADLPGSLTDLLLSASDSDLSGDVADLPIGLERLRLNPSTPITGTTGDLPRNMQELNVGGLLTGDVADLPDTLLDLSLRGSNTVSGSFADLPAGLTDLSLGGSATVTGVAADLPDTLESLDLSGQTVLTGDIADLTDSITRLVLSGSGAHTVGGDVSGIPTSAIYVYLSGQNTVGGDIAGVPASVTNLNLYGNTTVTGDIAGLHDGVVSLAIRGQNSVSGDLAGLPTSLQYLDWIRDGSAGVTLTTPSLPTGLSRAYLSNVLVDATSVDNFLEALWVNRDQPKPRSDRDIDLVGSSTPLPTTTTYLDQLRAYHSPDNDPQYAAWDITLSGEPDPGDPVDVGSVSSLVATVGNGSTALSWAESGDIDFVRVYRDGALVSTVEAGTLSWPGGTPPPPTGDGEVVTAKVSQSNLSITNRTTHSFTHTFEATDQDGKVALLLLFLGDDGDEVRTPHSGVVTVGESTHNDAGGIHVGYYIPTSLEVQSGSIQFDYTTAASEVYQFVILELHDVDVADLVEDFVYDGSNADRQSVPGTNLTTTKDGSLLVSLTVGDDTTLGVPSMSPDEGFTSVASYAGTAALPPFNVATKLAATAGSHATPTWNLSAVDEQAVVHLAINPAEGTGGGGPGGDPVGSGDGPSGTVSFEPITIPAGAVDEDLAGFPVYLDLSILPQAFWDDVQADGGDIRIMDSLGNRLPMELVSINKAAKTGEVHFLATVWSAISTTFLVWFDGGGVTLVQPDPASTYGRNNVWTDYRAVWHMDNSAFLDSTGNGWDGEAVVVPAVGQAVVGRGALPDGTRSVEAMPVDADETPGLMAWMSWADLGVGGMIGHFDSAGKRFYMGLFNGSFILGIGSAASSQSLGTPQANTPTHMAVFYDGPNTNLRRYIDGAPVGLTYLATWAGGDTETPIDLVARSTTTGLSGHVNGMVDEVRLPLVAFGDAYVKATHDNQKNPAAFFGILDPGGEPEPPPPTGSGDAGSGIFDLAVNTAFSDSNRVLKNGTAFTPLMHQIYDGLLDYYVDGDILTDAPESEMEVESKLASGDSYDIGRNVFRQLQPLLYFFRVTGDVRLLDELTRLAKVGYNAMRTTWTSDSPIWSSSHPDHRQPHGERFFPSYLSGDFYGNDTHLTDTARALRVVAQIGWAQRVNENVTSPKGHNFRTEADKWEEVMDGYERVWSKVSDSSWPSNTRVPEIYKGRSGSRADLNEWPVHLRTLTHTNQGSAMLALYMGRLLGKASVGETGMWSVMRVFLEEEVLYVGSGDSEHAVWGRYMETMTSASNYLHPMTYAEYSILDTLDLFFDGVRKSWGHWRRYFAAVARSLRDYVLVGTSKDSFTYKGDIGGKTTRSGTSISGRSSSLVAADGFSDQEEHRAAWHAVGVLMAFDDTGKLREWITDAWLDTWSPGGFSQPRTTAVPFGVFADEAGLFDEVPDDGGGTGGGGEGTVSLLGDPTFDPDNPTWWDGTAITGTALANYNGLLWWADEDNWDQHTALNNPGDGGLDDLASSDDLYNMGRYLRDRMQALFIAFGLSKDLRWLDTVVQVLDIAAGELAVGYRGHDTGVVTWSASPYRIWVTRGGGQPSDIYGTDLSTMNEVKWHATLAQATYALFLNRNHESPAGYDYEAKYAFWYDYLVNDFLPKWRGGGTSSWRDKYRGVRRDPNYDSPHHRALEGEWPVVVNGGEGHSSVSSAHLAYYMHKLTGEATALAEFEWMTDAWLDVDSVLIGGTHRVYPHSSPAQGSPSTQAQRSAYVNYNQMDMIVARVFNMWPERVNDDVLEQMANAFNDYLLLPNFDSIGSTSSKGTKGDIIGEVDRGGLTSDPDTGRTMMQLILSGYFPIARWAPTYTRDGLAHLETFSANGSTANPRVPFQALARLLIAAPLSDEAPGGGEEPPPSGEVITWSWTDTGTSLSYDGYVNHEAGTISSGGTSYEIGIDADEENEFWLVMEDVQVPQGAVITEARVTMQFSYSSSTLGRDVVWDWKAVNAANAAPPTTYAGFNALALTTAAARQSLTTPYTSGTVISSVDLKSVIQAIVNRPDWVPGNRIVLVGKLVSSNYVYTFRGVHPGGSRSRTFTVKYQQP